MEAILRWTDTPTYVFPKPMDVVGVLWDQFGPVFAHHLWVTMYEFLAGFAIGASIGLVLAALITQKPFAEKVIAPYILIMVMTPMIALVPFLRLKMGFGSWPLIIAVALASGPMVMLNSATGFRRTDLAKIALARSYGASTFQIFRKIRFPLALPMIIVGFMVGSIFGLLTAIGGEMVAPSEAGGLGERLVYYSSLARMNEFGAVICDHRRTRCGDLRPVLFHRQAMGQLGGLVAPEGGGMFEATLSRREVLKRGAAGAALLSAGSLLHRRGSVRAVGRDGGDGPLDLSARDACR